MKSAMHTLWAFYLGLRRGSAAARLLRLWVRISPEAWMSVCCEWCVFSGRGLCDGLITRPEESYRVWCECDREYSTKRKPWPTGGWWTMVRKKREYSRANCIAVPLPCHVVDGTVGAFIAWWNDLPISLSISVRVLCHSFFRLVVL
jgi:hypothetical protein